MFSMANRYYNHQSVRNPQEASIFSNEYTWTIFDALRDAGAKGLTEKDVHKELERRMRISIGKSRIYEMLRRMFQEEWIHRHYNSNLQARVYVIAQDWAGVDLDKDYDQVIVSKEKNYLKERLFPLFLDFVKRSMKDLNEDSQTSKWLPQRKDICKVCRISHEANEFFSSLLDIASAEFLDSNVFLDFLKENDFRENEHEE